MSTVTLVADPAWLFDDKLPGKTRGAANNYDVMPVEAIAHMTLPSEVEVAEHAYLFLWRVSAQVEEAYKVVREWGFVPKSEIVWQKLTKTGKKHFGMGHHTRGSHETCIIATRGRPERKNAGIRSTFEAIDPFWFEAQTPLKEDGKVYHSAKPDEFYKIVEELTFGPYIEMFSRKYRDGWTVYGNQLPKRGFGFKRSM